MKKIFFLGLFILTAQFVYAQTIKFESIFDNLSGGWQIIDADGSGTHLHFHGPGHGINPYAGNAYLHGTFQGANSQGLIDEWLISPQIQNITTGDSLIFFCGGSPSSWPDSLKVWVSTTNSLPSSFTEIAYFKAIGPNGFWHRMAFSLDQFAGNNIFFALNYYIVNGGPTGANSDNVWIDYFLIKNDNVTSITDPNIAASNFELKQNYPNPFNPVTQISFSIPKNEAVTLKVFNSLGEEVTTLVNNEILNAGNYSYAFWGNNLSSGVYFYTLTAGDFRQTKSMMLLK